MRHAHDDGVNDVGVRQQNLLDIAGHDVVAATNDDVLGSARDPQETVRIEVPEVAGAQPAVAPGLLGGCVVLVVAPRWPRSPDGDLASVTWSGLSFVVTD